MIAARLSLSGAGCDLVAGSIEPDNLPNMHLQIKSGCICLEFSTEKIGTLLSTIDDLLMNIKIAEETLSSMEER
jgi:tRNA threonylcarbamoyladenosine modification (KEOPS) complex  Pcc1 subunit